MKKTPIIACLTAIIGYFLALFIATNYSQDLAKTGGDIFGFPTSLFIWVMISVVITAVAIIEGLIFIKKIDNEERESN